MDEVDITIIGAGVVGLAVAAELASMQRNIVVLERNDTYGRETSSRNSCVIHSGIYYPPGSLKVRLCIEGADLLYELCLAHAIPHRRTGKLIVAAEQHEENALEVLLKTGQQNGVKDLRVLDRQAVAKMERAVIASAAIHLPHTGIIDVHALMKHFYSAASTKGVLFAFNSEVDHIGAERGGYTVKIRQDDYRFLSRIVINCAGLASDRIAAAAGMNVQKLGYNLKYCKGSYFSYAKPSPVNTLVYPLPHDALVGLGIHATLDLGGRLRFGPDAEYVSEIGFTVDRGKQDRFFEGAGRIIRGLAKDAFLPDMAGVRPKLQGPGESVRDFVIADETGNGLPGLINLIGIESPGLTAAPAIARHVAKMVKDLLAG